MLQPFPFPGKTLPRECGFNRFPGGDRRARARNRPRRNVWCLKKFPASAAPKLRSFPRRGDVSPYKQPPKAALSALPRLLRANRRFPAYGSPAVMGPTGDRMLTAAWLDCPDPAAGI
jgi:hypothetical protein